MIQFSVPWPWSWILRAAATHENAEIEPSNLQIGPNLADAKVVFDVLSSDGKKTYFYEETLPGSSLKLAN